MVWMLYATTGAYAAALLLCAVLLVLLRFMSRKQQTQDGHRFPPGPTGVPFLGCLDILIKGLDSRRAYDWSCSYGPVIRVKAAFSDTIILNNLDSIKAFLTHKDMLYRSPNWVQGASVDVGFSGYGGKKWDENRHFSLKLLRELGYGKHEMQAIITAGCDQFVNHVAEARGQPLDLFQLLLASVCNNIGVLLFGCRFPFEHPKHKDLVKSIREEFMASRKKSMVWLLPSSFITLARCLPFTAAAAVHGAMKSIEMFVRQEVGCTSAYANENRDCFIGKYLSHSKICSVHDNLAYNSQSLMGNTTGFLITGTVTISALLMRILLLVAANADTVQERIQREIDGVVGTGWLPTWNDRYTTPYTLAVIWEAQRWHTLLPLGLPRWACRDIAIGRYFVPQGTTIVPNIWAVHNDPLRWNEPEKFDPTRFLNESGSFASERLKSILPFSTGRRGCPGEILAPQEIYLYITRTLQKFRIVPHAKTVIDVCIPDDVIMEPGRHTFCCIPRESFSSSSSC